jgi:hypothetical protein
MTLCQEMTTIMLPEPKGAKAKAKPRAITNASGPKEWNVFVQATWQSMAAEKGILYEDFDGESKDKDFKEATKKEGITYQSAMKEASRRKALAEGKDAEAKPPKTAKVPKAAKAPKAAEPKATVPKAAASVGGASAVPKAAVPKAAVPKAAASVGGASAVPKAALETVAEEAEAEEAEEAEAEEAEAEETDEERTHREAQEAGWVQIQHNGVLHYKDVDCGEVYSFPQLECVGIYKKDGAFQAYV